MIASTRGTKVEPKSVPVQDLYGLDVSREVDARGLACPMPLLKAKQALHQLAPGDRLRVLATDGGSVRDFHSFASLSGHCIEAFSEHDNEYYYVILKVEKALP